MQGGQPEPAFPVRKTGVGDLRGYGVALVFDIDDSSESGCRVEQVEGSIWVVLRYWNNENRPSGSTKNSFSGTSQK